MILEKKEFFDLYKDKSHTGVFSEFFRKNLLKIGQKIPFFILFNNQNALQLHQKQNYRSVWKEFRF